MHQVLKIDPKNSKALYRKASVLKNLGRSEESLEVIQAFFDNAEAANASEGTAKDSDKAKSQQADIKLFN